MKYGFLIDHDRCIGCHACTVACKAENEVPVGNFRTWVKYVEKGTFPQVRRHFAVLRCNHCDNAPCVKICPVNALEKRADGIVDVDRDACIGCRACMQGCPYDAIYLNEDRGEIEKCHFCAHRVEKGLEPACVIVCPEQAIIAGDLDDPKSKIRGLIREKGTLVRRPEQKTGPNVHYKGLEPSLIDPGGPERPSSYLWSQRPAHKPESWPISLPVLKDTRVVLDAGHKVEWGWPVALYLLTKGIGAGAGMLAPAVPWLGLAGWARGYLPEVVALAFTIITAGLLIEDLKKPWAFYRLLTRPNWNSWLVKGGIILGLFGASSAAVIGLRLLGMDAAADGARWAEAVLGFCAAVYTYFLFDQCEGRDLWQSRWLAEGLGGQAVLCGTVTVGAIAGGGKYLIAAMVAGLWVFVGSALMERYGDHPTTNGKQGAAFLGTLRLGPVRPYRDGLILCALGVLAAVFVPVLGAALVLVGVYLYEWAYVRAGQLPPLS